MSMLAHPSFRMLVLSSLLEKHLGADPCYSDDRTRLTQLHAVLPEHFNLNTFDSIPLSLGLMGKLWSDQILSGLAVLDAVQTKQVLHIEYRHLLQRPSETLYRIAEFLGMDFIDEGWVSQACNIVGSPRSDRAALSETQLKSLTEACRPGFEALVSRGLLVGGC